MDTTVDTTNLDVNDVDFGSDDLPDLHERLHALRASKPAAWVNFYGERSLMFTGHDLVSKGFRDEETFPAAVGYVSTASVVMGHNLLSMRDDEHRVNRALVSPAFRSRLIPGYIEPLLEPTANALIDCFIDRGEADLVAEFNKKYPFRIITKLLGLPPTDEEEVSRLAIGILTVMTDYDYAVQCSKEFRDYLAPLVNRRRSEPEDDLISSLATTEIDGEQLTDEEIFAFILLLFPAGADTTFLGLGNTLYGLLTNPDQFATLAADPAEHARQAAEEGLRWNTPVAMITRRNPTDVVWNDMSIAAGTQLVFAVVAANRDPAIFDDPDRFDLSRRQAAILTFGLGAHFCLGAQLARVEMDVALRLLVERLPNMRLVDDGEVRIGGVIGATFRGPNRLPVTFG